MEKIKFSFEELVVWQKAVSFAREVIELTENINTERKHFRLFEQLESASTSIAMNIAEGSGRYFKKEFIKFMYISRGSLFETLTLLNIFYSKNWIDYDQFQKIRVTSYEISKMLSGLINSVRKTLN